MPPARKNSKSKQDEYGWVAGGMRGIKHEAFIARGGFGEVHKVTVRSTSLTIKMLNEITGMVIYRFNGCLMARSLLGKSFVYLVTLPLRISNPRHV